LEIVLDHREVLAQLPGASLIALPGVEDPGPV
jgi:hypothetical protein